MKRFFLFAAALSSMGILLTANAPVAFAQADTTPAQTDTVPAKISPAKKKSIQALIDMTGTVKAMRAAITAEIDQLQATNKSIPKEVLDKMRVRFDERLPVLVDRLVPVYDKNFTQEDIDSFIAFYKTPAGQKLADKMPAIQQESAKIGAQWGQEIGAEIDAEASGTAGQSPTDKPGAKTFDTRPFKGNGKPVTTKSGLKYEDMTVGTGATAVAGKTCVMHYTGTLMDGTKFDSSRDRGQPFPFPLGAGRVIKGWDEGVAGMKVGGRRKLTIPASLGYGEQGTPGGPIPPNATLIFDVELMDVK